MCGLLSNNKGTTHKVIVEFSWLMMFIKLQQSPQERISFMAEIRISGFHLRKEGTDFKVLVGPVHNQFIEVCLVLLSAWKGKSERK